MVVGGRIGAKDSNVGRAADEEVVETEDDLERAPADSLFTIDWLSGVCVLLALILAVREIDEMVNYQDATKSIKDRVQEQADQ
jgi:hypothetical protein